MSTPAVATHAPSAARVRLRWLYRRDMPAALAIESASFDDPWTEADFLRELSRSNCIGMAACAGGPDGSDEIVGFAVYECRRTHGDESCVNVLDVAVHPDHRRMGIGRQMIGKLVGKLSPGRRTRLVVRVRESNLAGHLFLRACGLRATAVERGARADGESEYRFEYCVGGDGIGEE